MRAMLSLGGLLVVLVIIALLAKKQMNAVQSVKMPAVHASAPTIERPTANGNVQQQSQQIQQQFKAATEAAMQQPRSVPE
ncbi:MAG: hypothetical protein IPH35_14795 [Rhodoferax sp.]|nr:hypothetical protein [Rhodoferax sp.]